MVQGVSIRLRSRHCLPPVHPDDSDRAPTGTLLQTGHTQCQVRLSMRTVVDCCSCINMLLEVPIYIYTSHTHSVAMDPITYLLYTPLSHIYKQAINLLHDLVKYLTSLRTLRMLRTLLILRILLLPLYNKIDLDLIQLILILILIEGILLKGILID